MSFCLMLAARAAVGAVLYYSQCRHPPHVTNIVQKHLTRHQLGYPQTVMLLRETSPRCLILQNITMMCAGFDVLTKTCLMTLSMICFRIGHWIQCVYRASNGVHAFEFITLYVTGPGGM